jgi:hypothetical protein
LLSSLIVISSLVDIFPPVTLSFEGIIPLQ